ncbi:MAG: T9SS type A sorting domain-containing protein, partial [Bacteroidia bacterium]
VYQCIISGACPPSLTTNPVTLTIDTLPVITMQPVTAHVCDGTNAVFSVSATGAGLTYQWQEDQGSGFSNLSNTTPYSGVTTSTLTIAASVAMSGYSYQCIVSGTCSPSVTTIPYPMIVYPTYVNYKPVTICQGDSVAFAGSFYSTPGLYPHLYSSRFGCDSLVYLSLNVSSAYFTTITSTICNGDTIMIGGMPETTAGTYTYILPTISGCDSTIENILTVKPSYHYTQSTTICAGDSALIFGIYETTAGTYYDYHTTYLGCDSSYAHTLIVGPLYNNSATVNICAGDSVLISGNYESVAGNYVDSLSSVSGCDSVFTTTLIVHPVSNVFQAISICSNDSIFLAGAYQNTAGTYTDNFVSIFGCDSTIVTNLDVKTAPAVSLNFPPFVCEWDPPTVLTEGTPSGGTYSGTGITSGNIFSPGIVGPGNYLITYTYSDSVACTVSVTDTLTVAICEGVNELANDESIVVYPNPFINVFTITSKANTATQLTIINVLGEVVYSQVLKTGTSEINMSSVEKGIYFIKINDSGKIITKKIIKE